MVIDYCWFPFLSRRTAITQTWRMPDYSNQVQLTRCCLEADAEQKLPFRARWGRGLLLREMLFSIDPLCFPGTERGH